MPQASHNHRFLSSDRRGETRTRIVVVSTLMMMIGEITSGLLFGSMALLADGWHMGTHAAALGIALFVYWYARRHQDDPSFTFGTGKVGSLGGFASAVGLAIVALAMGAESVHRFFEPRQIRLDEAIMVAVLGLAVNLLCAFLLRDSHRHSHGHGDDHDHGAHIHDHNLKAAYLHVLADALTSVFAIVALVAAKLAGLGWLDPVMGIVGAVVITKWSVGLLRETSGILLDRSAPAKLVEMIRESVEEGDLCRVLDLHVWRVSSNHFAAEISVAGEADLDPVIVRDAVARVQPIDHLTVEINRVKTD